MTEVAIALSIFASVTSGILAWTIWSVLRLNSLYRILDGFRQATFDRLQLHNHLVYKIRPFHSIQAEVVHGSECVETRLRSPSTFFITDIGIPAANGFVVHTVKIFLTEEDRNMFKTTSGKITVHVFDNDVEAA
jgi:hypothetical protein